MSVPSLLQLSFKKTDAPVSPDIRQNVKKKLKHQQIKKPTDPLTQREIIDFVGMMRDNLKDYLENDPTIPFNILTNFYLFFDRGSLNSEHILQFRKSNESVRILGYSWFPQYDKMRVKEGNMFMLLKYNRRIYLLIVEDCSELFLKVSRSLYDQSYQRVKKQTRQFYHKIIPLQTVIRSLQESSKNLFKIRFAVPITTSDVEYYGTYPLDFQSGSFPLSGRYF